MPDIKIIETEQLPLCPHCEKELNTVEKNIRGVWERHTVYICPHCRKLLSIGNDVGFGG